MRFILELEAGKSNTLEIMIPASGHLGNAASCTALKMLPGLPPDLKPQEGWFVNSFSRQQTLTVSRALEEIQRENPALLAFRLWGTREDKHLKEEPRGHVDGDG